MITRVLRLTAAELLKLRAHPFLWISLVVVVFFTMTGAALGGPAPSLWRQDHAIAMFASGARIGLKLSTYVLLIFGSMLFAGEFDKGTIKILLTRPITRTDLFAAKSIAAMLLALFLIATVLYTSLAVGCSLGELGPVWDDESYNARRYDELVDHAKRAVAMSVAAVVAAVFFGVLVSNLVESSGFATAIALTAFLVGDEVLLRVFRDDMTRRFFFSVYPGYAFDVLRDYATGSSIAWKGAYVNGRAYLWVPLATVGACVAGGFGVFKMRNITA